MNRSNKVKSILSLTLIFALSACGDTDVTYAGSKPELFSVGIHSLLGVRGFGMHLDIAFIEILEEDNYGRILFSYNEDMILSRLIIQKSDGDYAYFYPHYNFIFTSLDYDWEFTIEETDALKEANSWNQPMSDINEFERVPIVRQEESGPISFETLYEVYAEIFPAASGMNRRNVGRRMNFLRADRYGRSVYLAVDVGNESRSNPIAVVFQPDYSFDLVAGSLEITDLNNYQTELRLLMEANGWNEPWDD